MVKFLRGVYIQHTFDNKDFFKRIHHGKEMKLHHNLQFRVVPIDDSIVYRRQSEISPVANAFDDSKTISSSSIHQK